MCYKLKPQTYPKPTPNTNPMGPRRDILVCCTFYIQFTKMTLVKC